MKTTVVGPEAVSAARTTRFAPVRTRFPGRVATRKRDESHPSPRRRNDARDASHRSAFAGVRVGRKGAASASSAGGPAGGTVFLHHGPREVAEFLAARTAAAPGARLAGCCFDRTDSAATCRPSCRIELVGYRRWLASLITEPGNRCGICEQQLPPKRNTIRVDHIPPLSLDEGDERENLWTRAEIVARTRDHAAGLIRRRLRPGLATAETDIRLLSTSDLGVARL